MSKQNPAQFPPQVDLHKAHQLYLKTQPGPEAIQRLGEFLLEKVVSYPDFLERLVAEHQDVSYQKLKLALLVAKKQIDCRVAANIGHDSIRAIMYFPYEVQKELMDHGVDVVRGNSVVRMNLYDLSPSQRTQVFIIMKKKVRTVEEQREYNQHPRPARIAPTGTYRYMIDEKAKKVFVAPNQSIWSKEVIEIAAKILTLNQAIQVLNAVQARLAP